MSKQPRPAHYAFAHKVLPQDVFRRGGEVWTALQGAEGNAYLLMQWDMAAGGSAADAVGLQIAGRQQLGASELVLVQFPEPETGTEAHFAAIVKTGESFRYFVMEKGFTKMFESPRAFISEWCEDGSRVRGEDLPGIDVASFVAAIATRVGGDVEAPTEAASPESTAPASEAAPETAAVDAAETAPAGATEVGAPAVGPTQMGAPAVQPATQPGATQSGYPPAQGTSGYPPAQDPSGHPMQQGGYPPAQGYPMQGGYPPQGGYASPSMAPQVMGQRAPKKGVDKKVIMGVAGALGVLVVGGIGYGVYTSQQEAAAQAEEDARIAAIEDARKDARKVRDEADERLDELEGQLTQCRTAEKTAVQKVLDQARERRGTLVMLQRTPKNPDDLKGAIAFRKPSKYLPEAKVMRGTFGAEWLPTHDFVAATDTACQQSTEAMEALEKTLEDRPRRNAEVDEHEKHQKQVEKKLAALDGLDLSKPEERKTIVVAENLCMPRRVAVFTNSAGKSRYLWKYRCTATLRWLSVEDGALVAAVSASGNAKPSYDPGKTASFKEIDGLNTETRKAGKVAAKKELEKKLVAVAKGEKISDGGSARRPRPRTRRRYGMGGRLY